MFVCHCPLRNGRVINARMLGLSVCLVIRIPESVLSFAPPVGE